MLWLCLHLPQLPLSALGLQHAGSAVVDQRGSQRWLITDAPDCAAGTPLASALSLHPDLKVQVRRPAAEMEALRSLAYWIYRFGQPVTAQVQDLAEPGRSPRALLWVEIGQSLALFGGLDALRSALCSELKDLGHTAQLGIAPTRSGAALLACAGHSDPIVDARTLSAALSKLRLGVLHWPADLLHSLSGVGFRRLGDLFAVPRDAFSRRFGAAYRLDLDRQLGHAPEPCDTLVPPETFRRRFELSAEIEEVDRLQFPLKRLCTELQAYLRSRDCGLSGVTLAVMHAGARETRIHAQFVDPHRDAKRIFDALHERLDRDGLPLPARELVLMAEEFAEASVPQGDLFDMRVGQAQGGAGTASAQQGVRETQQRPAPASLRSDTVAWAWSAAIERIRARLGDDKVWTPEAIADHRPEFAMQRAARAGVQPDTSAVTASARPSFLAPEPWPMPAPEIPEHLVFERIESGWWDGHEIRRDYATLNINGGRVWVYRDLVENSWHLHGWWS